MIDSTRRLVGAALGIIAAVAVVWSVFINWYGGRKGSDIRLNDLFNQITLVKASTFTSLFIPLGVSALLILVGALFSRWMWVLGGLIALATVFMWGLRQAQSPTGLHASLMGNGPTLAAASGALMLIAAAVAPSRILQRRTAAPATAVPYDRTVDPTAAPAASAQATTARHARADDPTVAPAADQWAGSNQAYQQGYDHAQGQAAEQGQTLDETLGQKRDG